MSLALETNETLRDADAPPRPQKPRRAPHTGTAVISTVTLAALIGLWFAASQLGLVSPLFLPSPLEVLHQLQSIAIDGYAEGTLTDHILASAGRIGAALAFGIVLGIPLGLAMGLNRWAKGIFGVPIDLYWGLPPLAYVRNWRMTRARAALASRHESIKSVAADVGYISESAFGHAFRRHFGFAPRQSAG